MLDDDLGALRHGAAGEEPEHGLHQILHDIASFADNEMDGCDLPGVRSLGLFLDNLNNIAHKRHFVHS